MSSFRVIGPLELCTEQGPFGRQLPRYYRRYLKTECNQIDTSIANSKGCYIFGIRYHTIMPWYVGKTKSQSIINESLSDRNRNAYNRVLQAKKGSPLMFFIIPVIRPGPVNNREIGKLEQMLISFAWERNPDLLNTNLKDEWTWDIPGVWGTKVGRPTKATSDLKEMLGI
ncbi:hypothetical protein ACFLW1_02845 [Chloroflexota bacterium]